MKSKGIALSLSNLFELVFLYGVGTAIVFFSLFAFGKGLIWGLSGFVLLGFYYVLYEKAQSWLDKRLDIKRR